MKNNKKSIVVAVLAVSLALGLAGPIPAFAFASPATVDLRSAGNFVVLAKSGISTTGATSITGNIGVSPAAATTITGFGLTIDVSNTFSTAAVVSGKVYAANYAAPTPTTMTTAISNMEAAYTAANSRAVDNTDLTGIAAGQCITGTCDLTGLTLAPGVYTFTGPGNVVITGDVTLNGGPNDIWIFQIPGTLNISTSKKVLLTGGAVSSNVFWAVAGATTLGPSSIFEGNILEAGSVIALQTGATLHGKALSQFAVTIDAGIISSPSGPVSANLNVIKLVVGGTAAASDFMVHVKNASNVDVSGSPLAGAGGLGTPYLLSSGTYTVSEDANTSYTRTFTGDCDPITGSVTLAGIDKICTIVNTSNVVVPPPAPVSGGGSGRILPVIGMLKVPTPLALPGGSGPVTYNYTVWNVGGQPSLANVTVADDKCSPVVLVSGDTNGNNKLDSGEKWMYSCTITLSKTTTNTAVVTGYSDDTYRDPAIATAVATVAVGASLTPPLINIVKVPSQLTPFPYGGGNVTYMYTVTNPGVVPMNNVTLTDDKCAPVSRTSGDADGNNLLDPGEIWTYTCQSNILVSTRNTATARGQANGFTALGYAFANVLVAVPARGQVLGVTTGFPNTGFAPEGKNIPWGIVVPTSIFLLALISFAIVSRKRTN